MNWVQYEDVTFNLDQVTHFKITEREDGVSVIQAYLNVGNPIYEAVELKDMMGQKAPPFQVSIIVAKGTKTLCQTLLKKIIAGEYNLPCKGHLYPIREHLNTLNIALEKIESHLKLLAEKQ